MTIRGGHPGVLVDPRRHPLDNHHRLRLLVRVVYGATAPDVAANTTVTVTLTVDDGTAEVSDTLQVTVTDSPNIPPAVNAGQDQEVAEGATVALSGTVSDDDPGDTLAYSWTHDDTLSITITGSDSLSASFTAPDVAANTTVTVTLTVDDGTAEVSDTLQVTVTDSPNIPPAVNAGQDQEVAEGATVALSGTVSDDDPGDTLAYSWTHDDTLSITITGSDSLSASFTAPDVAANTTVTVTLTVDDGTAEVSDTLQVTITDSPNIPPAVNAGQDQEVAEGATVALSGTVSDDDPGDTLAYSWSHNSTLSITLDASALDASFTAPQVDSDTAIAFTLTADDGVVVHSDTVTVTVLDVPAGYTQTQPVVLEPNEPRDTRDMGRIILNSTQPGTIDAGWEAPNEAPVDYRIYWAKVGEPFPIWTDLSGNAFPADMSHTITGLEEGETYKVKVRARYGGTAGDWSGEVTITVAGTAPNAPATGSPAISGTAQVGQTLTADTSGITDENGMTNSTLSYQWVSNDGATDTDISGATTSSYVLAAGDQGRIIRVRVAFTDDAGHAESLTSAATPVVAPASTVPGAPTSLSVSPNGSGALDVSWQAPVSNGGSNLTGYTIQWKESTGSWDMPSNVTEATPTGTSHAITGLTDGTPYTVRVIATNSIGDGEPTSEETATPQAPEPPRGPRDIGRITLTSGTPGVIEASWEEPDEAPANYRIMWAKVGEPYLTWTDSSGNAFPTGTAQTITSLEEGETYKAKARASYDGTAGDWSGEATVTVASSASNQPTATVPGAPTGLSVSPDGSGALAVSWQAPASNGGSNLTGYTVQWKEASGSWDTPSDVTEATSTGTSHTITGLTDGTPYAIRVLATNDVGDGEPTPEETATPQAPAPPLGPRDIGTVTLSSTTSGTIQVSWDAPDEEPANYRVMWAKVGEPYLTWTDSTGNAFPTVSSHTITGLEDGEAYKLKVRASYDGTAGDWSSEVTVTVARTG